MELAARLQATSPKGEQQHELESLDLLPRDPCALAIANGLQGASDAEDQLEASTLAS